VKDVAGTELNLDDMAGTSRGKLDYRGNLITYLRDPRSVAVVAITDEVQL